MKIVVAGGTGFIGSHLVRRLLGRGHEVAVLTRSARRERDGARALEWDGRTQGPWSEAAGTADVVINLAGASIGGARWTGQRKRELLDSRVEPTRALVEAFRRQGGQSRTFVSASGSGFYGLRGDEVLDENAPPGTGVLADITRGWEAAAAEAVPHARLVILRFGVVLAGDGGALPRMLRPFRLFAGGPVGSGRQWMSWIARDDALRMIDWVIADGGVSGTLNATAPEPVRNADFARAAGRALHRPAFMPAPAFALRLLFGEMADELLLGGQRVIPARALAAGFRFELCSIDRALAAIV